MLLNFLFNQEIYHADFNYLAFGLITLNLIFPVFDKLTERSINELDCLKIIALDKLQDQEKSDKISSFIENLKSKLADRHALYEFKWLIMASFGFLILSTINNIDSFKKYNLLNMICGGHFIFLLHCFSSKLRKLITRKEKLRQHINSCRDAIEDPYKNVQNIEI